MTQTAVDWLIEQLVELDKQLDGRRKSDDSTVIKLNPTKIYEQAKEMEKKQIIEARQDGLDNGFSNGSWDSNLYYNKTYVEDITFKRKSQWTKIEKKPQ